MKPWTEARNINKYMKYHSKLTYQVVHPRPQTPQGESVAKPETPLLTMLNIACKYEVYDNLFSQLFEKQNPWTKKS